MNTFEPSFDESVLRALEKWPNVPACFGWLKLDRRGHWLLKGESITHPGAVNFINRNYASDPEGRWFIQNGPQKVYCELEYTPHVLRFEPNKTLTAHTGRACQAITNIFIDDDGNLLFDTDLGIGLLDDRDLVDFCAAIEDENSPEWMNISTARPLDANEQESVLTINGQRYPLCAIAVQEVPHRFTFIQQPADDASST